MLPLVALNKKAYAKLQAKSPWFYANEVHTQIKTPTDIYLTYRNEIVATAFYNPLSKLSIRVIAYEKVEDIDRFLKEKLCQAINKRSAWVKTGWIDSNAYRLSHSDADGLPGLILDRYDDFLIASVTTAGIERRKKKLFAFLHDYLNTLTLYEKADKIRKKEGLVMQDKLHYGPLPHYIKIKEANRWYEIDTTQMQKTGFYLDQRASRTKLSRYKPQNMLDLFAHTGGFGIASHPNKVRFVEISELACKQLERNAKNNRLPSYDIVNKDVFSFLESHDETYDCIVLDPPPFAKSRQAKTNALKGWAYLIAQSAKLLNDKGLFALFSCSHAIDESDLLSTAKRVAQKQHFTFMHIETFYQDIDHPIVLDIPASKYLSGVLLQKHTY